MTILWIDGERIVDPAVDKHFDKRWYYPSLHADVYVLCWVRMHLVEVESRETDFQSRPHKRGCTVQAVTREPSMGISKRSSKPTSPEKSQRPQPMLFGAALRRGEAQRLS